MKGRKILPTGHIDDAQLRPVRDLLRRRLTETRLNFEVGGRNTYPDFRLVAATDGFEVKGLA